METSKSPRGVFKGRYIDSDARRDKVRRLSLEQALEYEDSFEPSVRYVDSLKVARSIKRERTQPGSLGRDVRTTED